MDDSIFRNALTSLPAAFRDGPPPLAAMLLGSGWNKAADSLEPIACVPYGEIPGFGPATVVGHDGRLVLAATPGGSRVLVFCGRRHWYEGCEWEAVVMPAVLGARLGAKTFLVTNAAGAINRRLSPGDVVILRDHLRLSPLTPLRGPHNPAFGPRFPDQSRVYAPELREELRRAAEACGLETTEGVYALACGPAFETPAEIRAYGILGADVVGMSTVPEAMVASSMGLRVAGLSFVSNMAAGISESRLDGADVVDCAARHAPRMAALVCAFLERLELLERQGSTR